MGISEQQAVLSAPQFITRKATEYLWCIRSPVMHCKHIWKGFINKS